MRDISIIDGCFKLLNYGIIFANSAIVLTTPYGPNVSGRDYAHTRVLCCIDQKNIYKYFLSIKSTLIMIHRVILCYS